jgi:small subunit ribosomal protein S13
VGLTYIYGVGDSKARLVLQRAGVDANTYVKDLTDDEVLKLRDAIDEEMVEGDLRRDQSQNVKRLMEIGAYRGLRHRRGLPANGQRTKTNGRTRKGPRKMQIAGKKKVKK